MDGMGGANAKATLTVLRDVGIYFTDKANYLKQEGRGVEIKYIARDGNYAALYKGLVEEEIYEIKLQKLHKEKPINIRIFYYTLPAERIFYLVAAKHDHIDTSKSTYLTNTRGKFRRR